MKAKRILAALTAMAACSAMMGLTAFAEENVLPDNGAALYEEADITAESDVAEPEVYGASITSGDYTYTLSDSGEAYITKYTGLGGNVEIPAFLDGNPVVAIGCKIGYTYYYPFYDRDDIAKITIPNGVKTIGDYCFEYCDNLTVVIMPDTLVSIGNLAFYSCDNLVTADIPSSVTSIGENAFEKCKSLAKVNIPAGVTAISRYTFNDCSGLTSVTLPSTLLNIGESAFYNCSKLTSIEIPDSVIGISQEAFRGCTNLNSVKLSSELTTLPYGLFYDCTNLTSVTVPNKVVTMANCVFYNCKNLKTAVIPDSVVSMGKSTFYNCQSLESVRLSANIATINPYTFDGCTNLKSVVVPAGVATIQDYAFRNCKNAMIVYPESASINGTDVFKNAGAVMTYTITDGVATITNVTSSLKEITLPDDIYGTPIGYFTADYVGKVNHKHYPEGGCTICPSVETPVERFVERLYTVVLDRPSDPVGKANHVENLLLGKSACDVAYDFVFSKEFLEGGLSNEEVVTRMYRTFLDREPDEAGFLTWKKALDNGCSYAAVMYGFSQSKEFGELCNKYGIVQGTFKLTENRDQSANLTAFVNRLYNKTLGRNGEPDGLNSHTGAYLQDRNVERLAYNFVFSPEFTNKNHSNEEFVEIMYQAFFGRDSDPTGREHWLGVLANGGSRYDVFLGFIGSQECKELVESFGI